MYGRTKSCQRWIGRSVKIVFQRRIPMYSCRYYGDSSSLDRLRKAEESFAKEDWNAARQQYSEERSSSKEYADYCADREFQSLFASGCSYEQIQKLLDEMQSTALTDEVGHLVLLFRALLILRENPSQKSEARNHLLQIPTPPLSKLLERIDHGNQSPLETIMSTAKSKPVRKPFKIYPYAAVYFARALTSTTAEESHQWSMVSALEPEGAHCPLVWRLQGDSLRSLLRWPDAIFSYSACIDAFEDRHAVHWLCDFSPEDTLLEVLLKRALCFLRFEDASSAEADFNAVAKFSDSNAFRPLALVGLARVATVRKQWWEVLEYCEDALRVRHNMAEAYSMRAHAWAQIGDASRAAEEERSALLYSRAKKVNAFLSLNSATWSRNSEE